MSLNITICGGGNAAHTLAGTLGSREDLAVRVFAPFRDEVEQWQAGMKENQGIIVQTPTGEMIGMPQIISRDPKAAVAGSQIIFLALPAFAHEFILKQISRYIAPGAWVGALPARGGFDLSSQEVLKEQLSDVALFGFQTLPWACRIQDFGKRVMILGTKEQVDLAALPARKAPELSRRLSSLLSIPIQPVSSFLSLTLADTGQIIHPGIMYGLFHKWDGRAYQQPCLFYQSVDGDKASLLQGMSDEIQLLRAALEDRYPKMDLSAVRPLDVWLRRSYPNSITDPGSLQSSFVTNQSYTGLLAPMISTEQGYLPDFSARYLSEDVPYNLVVSRGIAELAGVDTPTIERVITWAQERLGKEYLVDGRLCGTDLGDTRSPQRYGYESLEQFVQATYPGIVNRGLPQGEIRGMDDLN